MKIYRFYLLLLSFVLFSCNGQNPTIEATAFAKKIESTPNPQILDVRTPEEFAGGHIEKAENINWLADDFVANVEKKDKTKPVFVYCKSGGRSKKAAEKLKELGFTTIYELEGGMLKWDAAGLSKPSDKIIGICDQEYAELLKSDKKVLVDFYADWCAPCKQMAPYLLKMQKEMKDKIVIVRLNADENKTMMNTLKISELPTLLLYKNGQVTWKHSGFISEEELKKQL